MARTINLTNGKCQGDVFSLAGWALQPSLESGYVLRVSTASPSACILTWIRYDFLTHSGYARILRDLREDIRRWKFQRFGVCTGNGGDRGAARATYSQIKTLTSYCIFFTGREFPHDLSQRVCRTQRAVAACAVQLRSPRSRRHRNRGRNPILWRLPLRSTLGAQ